LKSEEFEASVKLRAQLLFRRLTPLGAFARQNSHFVELGQEFCERRQW
jgi:hypothetical protein